MSIATKQGKKVGEREEVELEAAVLRRLLKHFDERKDVQNIELMILAGFCRNCLSKWLVEEGRERGLDVDIDSAREKVYGMPYDEWKETASAAGDARAARTIRSRRESEGETRRPLYASCTRGTPAVHGRSVHPALAALPPSMAVGGR